MFSDSFIAGAGVFMAVFAVMIALGYLLNFGPRRGKAAHRLRSLAATSPASAGPARADPGFMRPLLVRLARAGIAAAARTAELRAQCLRAGFFHPNAPLMFVGARVVLTVVLAAGCALAALYGLPQAGGALGNVPLETKVGLIAFAGGAVGMLAPGFWLSAKVRQRRRALRHALPDALDMLILCLEGGVSLNAAMQRVTDELQIAHPLLALEMNIVQREMQLGLTAGEALRKFADRCGLPDVRDLALVLLQSERYGASATKALRGYGEAARLERQQEAEEIAQKAAVKILFPTLLCIFPAIFVVVLGPAAFQMARLFSR